MEPAPPGWRWREAEAVPVPVHAFCGLCTSILYDRCPCMRRECLWILCPPCAQRRLGHKGRWERPGKLVGLGLPGALRARGERLGYSDVLEGIFPGHPWGSPPLSVSPIQPGGCPLFGSSPQVSPSPGLPVGLPVFPGSSYVFFKEGRVRWVQAVTPAAVSAPIAGIIARFL
jgi:hypothetical protein